MSEKAEDNAMVLLEYLCGTIVETIVSFTVISPPTNSLEMYGTKGTIIENHEWKKPVKIFSNHESMGNNKGKWYEPEIKHGPYPRYYEISMGIEDSYFTDCIINDAKPDFSPEQAREAIKTVLLSYLSAKTEKFVTVDDLMEVQNSKGTRSILEGLEKYVNNNYCLE